ncbi:nickel/cobalt transporter [Halomonas organivorans]|uniref:Nickel/cobalt efflux system n=1 Tax=Halomonas organivorans TaxID=257772 RepID=A0A7W5G623_9GAMM|nr:nickel/cobalt transporter [Halomonas organivorans]MBB3141512.1 ABC-type nickel/cobalt efflux system permease component RcnA [Halomonas organivorans]
MQPSLKRMTSARRWPRLVGLGALTLAVLASAWYVAGQGLGLELVAWQRDLHRALTEAITRLSDAPGTTAWLSLLGLSFGYGVFHAAGPGHGKAVLSTYLLSQGGALRRALLLSCLASLLQALVAIGLVTVLVHGLGWLTRQAMGSVTWLEQASYLLVALLGGWLCWRALAGHGHAHRADAHAHDHDHDAHECDCAHHLTPDQAKDWRGALAVVVSIGMRPCSGSVLLVGAASLLGHYWSGVLAVLAMAAGTALTVSALALASVMARDWAERRLARSTLGSNVERCLRAAGFAGGAIILMLGLSLFVAGGQAPADLPLLDPAPTTSPFGG